MGEEDAQDILMRLRRIEGRTVYRGWLNRKLIAVKS